MTKLLLLSSSRVGDTGYLEHAEALIKQHLTGIDSALFIPYAGVSNSFDDYFDLVAKTLSPWGIKLTSLHHARPPVDAINQAKAILVGGGNTFHLLNALYKNHVINALQNKIRSGAPYVGWSAGSNVAAPTICTTNDMPIIEPESFKALSLLPFQINPHYIDGNPPGHNGETREQRINEFLQINQDKLVVGIPEGTALKRMGDELTFKGDKPGFLFSHQHGKQMIQPEENLSHLL